MSALHPKTQLHFPEEDRSMVIQQPQSTLVAFLQRPFTSWPSTITYFGLCVVLLSVIIFLGKKYLDIIRRRPALGRGLGLSQRPSDEPFTSQHIYPRTPYPRSPLFQVTSAANDTSISDTSQSSGKQENAQPLQRRIVRMPIIRNWVRVGSVEEGHIAKRRRLSSSKVE